MPVIAPAYEEQIVESIPSEPHAEMIRLSGQKKVAEETLDGLYEKTDGWAGLVLLLEKAKKEGITPQLIGKVTEEGMFDYFANRVFGAAPELL